MRITRVEKSAIIGYWRMGAKVGTICKIMKKPLEKIDTVICEYFKYEESLWNSEQEDERSVATKSNQGDDAGNIDKKR